MVKVNIVNKSGNKLPEYKTLHSAGMDVRANIDKEIVLKSLERILIPTGLFIELPEGYEAQIRPRSGMALKKGIAILNSPGTIDADYRGEIGIIVANLSDNDVSILPEERIAQMVIAPYTKIAWNEVNDLNASERGVGGFGSTGTK